MTFRKPITLWLGAVIFLIFSATVSAQDGAPFRVEVAQDSIRGDEVCKVKFTIEDLQGEFEPPEFDDFAILGAPHRSSFFQNINGKTTRLKSYTFFLRPKKSGLLLVPSAQFKSDDQNWNTRAVDVWVQPGTLPADPPGDKRQGEDRKSTRL